MFDQKTLDKADKLLITNPKDVMLYDAIHTFKKAYNLLHGNPWDRKKLETIDLTPIRSFIEFDYEIEDEYNEHLAIQAKEGDFGMTSADADNNTALVEFMEYWIDNK